jgi:Protein of unknown function (DUF3606)
MHAQRKPAGSSLPHPRLHVYDLSEVTFWAREFGVSETKLMRAVEKAGTSIEAVRDELRSSAASEGTMLWKAKTV